MRKAKGLFELASWHKDTYEDLGDGAKLTRVSVTQTCGGDGTGGGGEWLMGLPPRRDRPLRRPPTRPGRRRRPQRRVRVGDDRRVRRSDGRAGPPWSLRDQEPKSWSG